MAWARKTSGSLLVAAMFVGLWFFTTTFYERRHDSALLHAINAGDVAAARQAFTNGATMRMPLRRHFTFLQAAAARGNVGMAKVLVEHGAANTLNAANDDGRTALDIAHGHAEMVDYLRSLNTTNRAKAAP